MKLVISHFTDYPNYSNFSLMVKMIGL